jgi:cytochrome c oxidase subunit 2
VRNWSLLFLLAFLFSLGASLYGPLFGGHGGWWLPRNVSTMGRQVDHLFLIIFWITGVVFVGTQVAICWAAWKFAEAPGRRAVYFHGSQRLEVIWTIIPSAILVFIALYQMGTWAGIKFRSQMPKVAPIAEVTARQFQWKVRYPGPDGRLHTPDDLFAVNELHIVKDAPAKITLKSQDVLHSFFIPEMRIKQDAVPGLEIPVWFDANEPRTYELTCAELCGWGHYKMRAVVVVHKNQGEFDDWMTAALAEQNRSQLKAAPAPKAGGNQVASALEGSPAR